ncbi:hypothetical protein C0991_006120 [Blastosporella zonata]|nr:hypothetical protein C0991_006120 [Blastosporella zonata]
MRFFLPTIILSALASRALAFTISVNNVNLTTSQLLSVPDSVVSTTCATNCTSASSALQACNDDANCLCRADTVVSLLNCEQCMFTKLVEINQKMDFRVGSQAVLSGYAASCLSDANITLAANQTALTLPSTWDGPFVAVLPAPMAAVAVGSAGILGISALLILSNL